MGFAPTYIPLNFESDLDLLGQKKQYIQLVKVIYTESQTANSYQFCQCRISDNPSLDKARVVSKRNYLTSKP